jgi:hypothetical protein
MTTKHFYDLTKRAPRSARVRIGGYVILARMLDKGRALLEGKNGEYNFDCPLDKRFLEFTGVKGEEVKKLLEQGKGDGEILEWINQNAPKKHADYEIAAWSAFQEERAPTEIESRNYFNNIHTTCGAKRADIKCWFDLLDLDDHVSFGGVA